MMTSWIYNSRSHHCIEMKLNNISRIWNFIHKDLKNEKFPENYDEDAQLKFLIESFIKYNHPEAIDFLKKSLKNKNMDFNIRNIFNLMVSFVTGICPVCGKPLRFVNIKNGYDSKCLCCKQIDKIENVNSKNDLYLYIIQHSHTGGPVKIIERFYHNENISKIFKIFSGNLSSDEDIFLYLTDKEKQKCKICGKETKFISFAQKDCRPYNDFCSKECRQKMVSIRQKENNTCNRMDSETKKELGRKVSEKIKERISKGLWTPQVTNSWCHSKIKIKFYQKNVLIEKSVRSSWEAMFYLMNPELDYEKLRIPYYDNRLKTLRNYIVDFIDNTNKIVYEIKPAKELESRSNPEKIEALINWCNNNQYNYKIITEEYFIKNEFRLSLLKYTEETNKEKLKNIIFKYSNFNIVKDEN